MFGFGAAHRPRGFLLTAVQELDGSSPTFAIGRISALVVGIVGAAKGACYPGRERTNIYF